MATCSVVRAPSARTTRVRSIRAPRFGSTVAGSSRRSGDGAGLMTSWLLPGTPNYTGHAGTFLHRCRFLHVLSQLVAGDRALVDLVRTVGQAKRPQVGVHGG